LQSAAFGNAEGDVIQGFENVSGSGHGDTLTGDAGGNVFLGREGDDAIFGGDGDDSLRGGVGADRLDGGDGDEARIHSDLRRAIKGTRSSISTAMSM